jgi:tetratricopeptide (TPR) repeat protein
LITELGQHREALFVLEQVPPPFDQEPDVLVLRAECLWQLDPDKKKAQALVDAALRSDPQSVSVLTLWGKLLLHQERPHESVAVLEQARRLDPFDHKCRNQLIAAYAMLVREAEDDLVRSLAVQGLASSWRTDGAPCPGSLVCCCAAATQQRYYAFMREDHMKASQIIVDTLLKLSELSAKAEAELWNADVRFQIGAIWVQLRRPGMARMWLTAALACDPQHQGAQEALTKLELEEILLP